MTDLSLKRDDAVSKHLLNTIVRAKVRRDALIDTNWALEDARSANFLAEASFGRAVNRVVTDVKGKASTAIFKEFRMTDSYKLNDYMCDLCDRNMSCPRHKLRRKNQLFRTEAHFDGYEDPM